MVLDVRDGVCRDRVAVTLSGLNLRDRARILREHDVDELVCGAMSCEAEALIREEGITVHPFVAGEIDQVVGALLQNELDGDAFSMPGCSCARRRRGARRGRCRGASAGNPER